MIINLSFLLIIFPSTNFIFMHIYIGHVAKKLGQKINIALKINKSTNNNRLLLLNKFYSFQNDTFCSNTKVQTLIEIFSNGPQVSNQVTSKYL